MTKGSFLKEIKFPIYTNKELYYTLKNLDTKKLYEIWNNYVKRNYIYDRNDLDKFHIETTCLLQIKDLFNSFKNMNRGISYTLFNNYK